MTERTILVYGTLRPGKEETVEVEGFKMYDLGWFPGVRRGDSTDKIVCERISVKDDEHLAQLDRYEGYREEDPMTSLYVREKVGDDFIYVFNSEPNEDHVVEGGDWLAYRNEAKGRNAQLSRNEEEESDH